MLAKFSGLNPKGPYLSLEKEKETFCVVSSSETQGQIKGARESLNGRKNIWNEEK